MINFLLNFCISVFVRSVRCVRSVRSPAVKLGHWIFRVGYWIFSFVRSVRSPAAAKPGSAGRLTGFKSFASALCAMVLLLGVMFFFTAGTKTSDLIYDTTTGICSTYVNFTQLYENGIRPQTRIATLNAQFASYQPSLGFVPAAASSVASDLSAIRSQFASYEPSLGFTPATASQLAAVNAQFASYEPSLGFVPASASALSAVNSQFASYQVNLGYTPASVSQYYALMAQQASYAYGTVGTSANNIIKLDGNAKLPAVDGSQLTNLPSGSYSISALTATGSPLTATINRSVSDKFTFTPSAATILATSNFTDMQEAILDINSGADLISYPATWYWKGSIPTLECYGINRIKIKSTTYNSAVRLVAESDFAYRYPNGNDSYTKLLLNFESDTIIDWSASAHTVTNTASGVTRDTSIKKFGRGSGNFDGSHKLDIDITADFTFGTGDLCIEFWLKTSVDSYLWSMRGPVDGMTVTDGKITIYTSRMHNSGTANVADGNWHHVAWVRYSGNSTIYVDGTSDQTWSDTSNYGAPYEFPIGYYFNAGQYFTGKLDCFRVSKGAARYTAAFTPSTIPFQ